MILHRLTLRDFGLFFGQHTFSLTPRTKYGKRRPVVLIGGKNGTGKTTILEAVRLCLYGPRSLGDRVSRKEYHEYLASTVHHGQGTLLQLKQASVALDFEHSHSGEKNHYHVERRWEVRRSTKEPVRESLILHKNSQPLSDFEAEHWQDFLNELIPIGLSQLFFFDGEKIQGLAEDTSSPLFLADAIKSLLGVDLVDQLGSDLKIYLNRRRRDSGTEELIQTINATEKQQQDIDSRLSLAKEAKSTLEEQIAELESQIALEEERLAKEGGGYARQRENLKTQQARLTQQISDLENQIREACAGLFPFALIPSLCEQLKTQLTREDEHEKQASAYKALEQVLKISDDDELWEMVSNRFKEQFGKRDAAGDFERRHALSSSESRQLLNWLDLCLTTVPEQSRRIGQQYEACNRQLHQIETALGRIPSDEVLKPMMQRLTSLNQQLGGLQSRLKNETDNMQSLAHRWQELQRELDRLHESQTDIEADRQRSALVEGVRSVLNTYSAKLTRAKVEALMDAVAECFAVLCRKQSMVQRIHVDPRTFATALFDRQDRLIPKEELSAGEKQIYAISLLWGLAKASGRPLPMIVDTPLGRLDSEHRGRMIEHYFPNASHQVVVLSTDTELDKQNFEILSPHVSHAYHLAYNELEGRTDVEERYFWRTQESVG
ncbi:MAG: DNA sulfur modification protein DndD [Candidatus Poribacteria bacterium]|nr:DNA sulfur modification protein DndD [Candidatus Poribacteria bacterium]